MTLTLPWEFSGLCSKDYWASLCPALAPVFFPTQEEVAIPGDKNSQETKNPLTPSIPPVKNPSSLMMSSLAQEPQSSCGSPAAGSS